MFACAWIGLGAGLLPRATGRREIAHARRSTARPSAFVYGLLLNLSFWPFTLGARDATCRSCPARRSSRTCTATCVFDATTSLGWDTGRAITNALLIAARRRRRARRAPPRRAPQASFDTPATFEPADLEPA